MDMGDMDMGGGDSSMDMTMKGHMTPYFHFTSGESLFFETWTPSSKGALAGAALALVVLALFERWLSATRMILEAHWNQRTLALMHSSSKREKSSEDDEMTSSSSHQSAQHSSTDSKSQRSSPIRRTIMPFIPSHDLTRGALYALQSLVSYLLMLAVMTFQVAYIIAIVVGLGLGEVIFGRMKYMKAPTNIY
jgi:copper transporter 1